MPIAAMLLPEFDQEMANTRKTLERIPEDKFSWTPHRKSFTMIRLASHIRNVPGWLKDTMTTDTLDIAPPGAPPYKEEPAKSSAELLAGFDKNVQAARAALEAATDEAFMASWSLLMTGKVMFTMPRAAVVRGMILNHIIHHRAQLTVYLRLNDIPVPALYGPSADESNF